jgi:hypothetical protein
MRIAVTGAGSDLYALVREACGVSARGESAGGRVGYVGRDFRTYGFMRVAQAVDFYAALNAGRWDDERIAADLAVAGLRATFEIRRMKRAYARALVLALTAATSPEMLVVEAAEEFDEAPAFALLERCVARSARAVVAFGASPTAAADEPANDVAFDRSLYDTIVDGEEFAAYVRSDPMFFTPTLAVTPLRVSSAS